MQFLKFKSTMTRTGGSLQEGKAHPEFIVGVPTKGAAKLQLHLGVHRDPRAGAELGRMPSRRPTA